MLKTILLLLRTFAAGVRSRRDLTLENLALRHQFQVALRQNPHPRLQNLDGLLPPFNPVKEACFEHFSIFISAGEPTKV